LRSVSGRLHSDGFEDEGIRPPYRQSVKIRKNLFFPIRANAETEAKLCGTSFIALADRKFYLSRCDPAKDL